MEQSNPTGNLFYLNKINTPCRQFALSVQRSATSEMAASEDLLLINDRDYLLLFDLNDRFDGSSIPEMIEWKHHCDGKILDLHYSPDLKVFLLLTEEKLFSFQRPSSLVCLSRLTSLAWSCTTMDRSIYLLHKHSTSIEQWTFSVNLSSIQMTQQWKSNEIIPDSEHDQHLRCIRTNPSRNQLAVLIVSRPIVRQRDDLSHLSFRKMMNAVGASLCSIATCIAYTRRALWMTRRPSIGTLFSLTLPISRFSS